MEQKNPTATAAMNMTEEIAVTKSNLAKEHAVLAKQKLVKLQEDNRKKEAKLALKPNFDGVAQLQADNEKKEAKQLKLVDNRKSVVDKGKERADKKAADKLAQDERRRLPISLLKKKRRPRLRLLLRQRRWRPKKQRKLRKGRSQRQKMMRKIVS